MDFKRLLLALSLSFLFIFTWQTFFVVPNMETNKTNAEPERDVETTNIEHVEVEVQKIDDFNFKTNQFNISTDLMELGLDNGGTSISNLTIIEKEKQSFKHLGYWDYQLQVYDENSPVKIINTQTCNPCLVESGSLVLFSDDQTLIEYDSNNKTHNIQSRSDKGITKNTILHDTSYVVNHIFSNLNPSKQYTLVWNGGLEPTEKNVSEDLSMSTIFVEDKKSYDEEYISEAGERFVYNNIGWAGLKTKYFMKAITNQEYGTEKIKNVTFESQKNENLKLQNFVYNNIECEYGSGHESIHVYSYIGPIDTKHLEAKQTSHLVQLFGFGWFIIGYLAQIILWLLTTLYAIIPNYGIICILFAFLIRIFTGPLTKQSFLSNQKLQKLQPKIKKIQEKYKADQGKLSQATMELYKKEGVNPIGGCLPILIQMPLLIALFQVFRKTIEFRGAEFLPIWITDLSQPDIIIQFAFLKNIPGINYFFGHGIALLPIIMGVVMFLSMKTTATSTEPSQKFAMYFMNAFFVLLFNTFPSGLNLYYTIYNILNFIQQHKLKQLQI